MKIREFLNKANRLVTYTREQLESFDNAKIDCIAGQLSGKEIDSITDNNCYVYMEEWEDPTLFQPTQKVYMTEVMTQRALEHDSERYVKELADVTEANWHWDGCEGNMSPEGIAWLLQATPRQRTIAAILTLQGQGGTGE
ncbi:hypothetical protein P4K96_29090 [Bacillus cereus]|uniref:hypothetical protein n=1 Tax=Paenibacillus melissococcoides TaxID=2912268 RepID=UPI002DC486A5|nr:hypothetical protein [Bacillus cereus]